MKVEFAPHLTALVIKWSQTAPAATARELSRRLVEKRLPATWSVDQLSQIESLASWGALRAGAEAALIVRPIADGAGATTEESAAAEISRRLLLMRTSGLGVDVVHAGGELTSGPWPRTLRALGILGVVVDAGREAGSARALPFGVWKFTPHASVPRRAHWRTWFRRRRPAIATTTKGLPAVIAIDVAGLESAASRTWRELEQILAETSEARTRGSVDVVTVNHAAAKFTRAHSARPQRSILRAAA